jgi:hypothetical protein
MKKLIFLVIAAALAGCSKSSPDPDFIVIKYQYTADVSSSYTITYTDQQNLTQTVNFTGTTWSETFTASASGYPSGFNEAFFSLSCTASPAPTLNGKMTISSNNKVVEEAVVPLVPNGPSDYSIYYIPFK